MARALKCRPHRTNSAIHHIGGANDVGTRIGLRKRHFHQRLNGTVIDDLTVFDEPIMAVDVVGIERDVCHNGDLGHRRFDGTDGPVGMVVRIPSARTVFGALFESGVGEKANDRDAQISSLAGGLDHFIDRAAKDTWHRRNGLLYPYATPNKNGPNEIIDA